ncbi:Lrp/AsnC ligand binding domain-containing protein [Arthrobacter psychrolactophilus]
MWMDVPAPRAWGPRWMKAPGGFAKPWRRCSSAGACNNAPMLRAASPAGRSAPGTSCACRPPKWTRPRNGWAGLEEVRLITHTVGPYDLIMDVWLRTLAEVQRLENQIELRIDGVSTADRSVVLRSVKQMGQIMDSEGRAIGHSRL